MQLTGNPEAVKIHGGAWLPFPVFYPVPPPDLFQSPSIPTTFVISREGKIVTKKTGSANWDSKAADRMFEELVR